MKTPFINKLLFTLGLLLLIGAWVLFAIGVDKVECLSAMMLAYWFLWLSELWGNTGSVLAQAIKSPLRFMRGFNK